MLDHDQSSPHTQPEAALRASEARLWGVIHIAEDAIISVGQDQCIQLFNQGAEKIFGYQAAEVLGQPLDVLLPQRFHTVHHRHLAAFAHAPEVARTMGERREIWGRRKNGAEFPAEASIAKLGVGDDWVFTVILRDITARKRVADELERQVVERTAHLNALLQFSQELFGARSLDAVFARALNHAVALLPQVQHGAIFLCEGERLVLRASLGFADLPPRTIVATGLIDAALRTKQPQIINTPADGERFVVAHPGEEPWTVLGLHMPASGVAALPLVIHGEGIGVLVLLRTAGTELFVTDGGATLQALANLTAAAAREEHNQRAAATLGTQLADLEAQQRSLTARLNEAEAGMLQAARLAAVGQLAASVAHEINNPLYAARNALFLFGEDVPPEHRASPYLRLADEQLGRIARIIERMRDFYRPTRGELGACDLNQLLEDTLQLAELNLRNSTITMHFLPTSELPPVLGNADQLRQVFLNLVLNAIEAMSDGDSLTVRTERGPTVALVEIADTGVGIPPDIRARLFEPFFTTKSNGTGLGLSISAHIVTQHGGQIEVASQPGRGTTFRIVLPYEHRA